jgi:RraA family protein
MSNIGCVINTNFNRASSEDVNLFKDMAVANIGDCMNRTAAVQSSIRPYNNMPLLGTAFTVKVAQGDNLMFHKAMDLAKPGDVIVIDAGGFVDRAILGELMLSYCMVKGINGVIVDGSIRDCEQIGEMDISVYAKGVSPNGPYKNGPGEIGTVISFAGQVVHPGDIVVGDQDGIVFIRPSEAKRLAEQVEKVEEKEQKILKDIFENHSYDRPWVDEILTQINCEIL